ncbi:putative P2Y purinoceptor 10 [Lepisosteus oculatus]|nr:PREDICTED: putative P2Y purinoceptor 10 [Lepisosteus oculatus]XP_015207291.1 PREDICTED: putative P2Y purinoceptor 10 [Lepisosteus oculatus]
MTPPTAAAVCRGSNVTCNSTCPENSSWDESIYILYTVFYLVIFIPGLLGNSLGLFILCRFISKKTKAVIFMINLAVADLAHVLSLPLRIYYYVNHTWPFGKAMCLLCFYLKYLNMYASIAFLMCISLQRCIFLMKPFCAKDWKRRYDVRISLLVWLVVGACCSPFILMRSSAGQNSSGCFKDLPTRKLDLRLSVTMMTFAELCGFVIPLAVIATCTWRIMRSLRRTETGTMLQDANDKRRALRLVLMCTVVFLLCFAPYHVNFLFYLMSGQDIITYCPLRYAVRRFHPISLCLASLNCCLNPFIYYFLTTEFRQQLSRHGSSVIRGRLMSRESASSFRD